MSEYTPEGRTSQDDRPLTDQEYQLLQRLLSDPFSLPIAFKTWIVSFLESSDMNLPISAINGLKDILGIAGVGGGTLGIFPAGMILPYAVDTPPTGSLLCDGASYSQTTYARLFAAIGSRYGGATGTFNVPDIRGRIPVMKGTNAAVDTLGDNEGLALGSRQPAHGHTSSGGPHTHPSSSGRQFAVFGAAGTGTQGPGSSGGSRDLNLEDATGSAGSAPTVGGALPANNTPAYFTLNFIIIY